MTIERELRTFPFVALPSTLNSKPNFMAASLSLIPFCGWYQRDPTWCIKLFFSTRKIEDRLCSRFSLNELIAWLSVPNKTIIAPQHSFLKRWYLHSFVINADLLSKRSLWLKAWFQMRGKRDQTYPIAKISAFYSLPNPHYVGSTI